MLVLNLAGGVSERTLTTIAKDLKEKLEGLSGVLEVNLVGVREELMEVIVDPLAMESYGLDQAQIIQFVSLNNRLVAAGSLQSSEGRFPIKVPGVVESAEDVLNMPIKAVGDRVVHFKDIADVRRTFKDAESYARLNGEKALAIEVVQRAGANVIDTVDAVFNVIAEERQYWPVEVSIVASRNKSNDVNDMLTELQNSVLISVLLVFIIIIGILGIRSALLVGVAVPGSFLMGILLIGSFGITINMMVLFALIMAVGMLVDGAIVVTEMADRRMAEGESRKDAYSRAAIRMSWPIIASTCTTLAAFVPLALWPGTTGEFMKYLPITLISIVASRNKSNDVNDMLTELQNSVLISVLLVFIIIIGILGIRSALLVGVAVPGSFLMGILLIGSFGITINMMVLFALIMAVGMLVDGAIVVTEMADRRMAEGESRKDAYSRAAIRMSWPIIASTCTTLAAFVPLALWPGTTGEFMKYLPITLIAVLSASLIMALLFVPTLGSIFGKTGATTEDARRNLAAAETGDLDTVTGFTGRYVQFLKKSLRHPWLNVGAVTVLLLVVYALFIGFGRGIEYFPDVEQPFGMVDIRARGDLSTDEKDFLVRQVEERVLGMPEIEYVYAKTGGSSRGAEDQIGTLTLNYIDWDKRRKADEILAEIRANTSDLVGVTIETRKPDAGPPQGKPIRIEFSSRFPDLLESAVSRVVATMRDHSAIMNIEDSRPLPGIEWQLRVDRAEAARFGADVALVGAMVQLVTNGIKIGEYRPDDSDDEIDIRVRYPLESRNLTQIDELRIPTANGLVPISTFVTREPAQKVSTIRRTDMRRTITIDADVAPGFLPTDIVAEIRKLIPTLEIDPRVGIAFRGSTEDQEEDQAFLMQAMLMALAMMAIILVTQFNSIYQAGLILTAVLFSTGGVLLGHLFMGKPFGVIMSSVGVITLAGIVVNNNIVFIDSYNVLRSRGAKAYDAVIRTCAIRLRPVLLTTVTTIIGLLPMVFGININLVDRSVSIGAPSSQWWTQLASSVAGGLAFATVLTLFLTPSLLLIQANTAKSLSGWRERREAARMAQRMT